MLIQVKFTKIGPKIKYELPFKMFCKHGGEIQNTMTLNLNDGTILTWLGKKPEKLFKKSPSILKKVELSQIYDCCDSPRNAKFSN